MFNSEITHIWKKLYIQFIELIVTMVSCSIPMDFLYQFSYGVRVNLVYLIHHANLADPTFLGVTLTTGKLCLTSIVQIAWRLYSIVSYETINEFIFSRKHNMTETVYIYNHWTTGWSFTKKIKCPKWLPPHDIVLFRII